MEIVRLFNRYPMLEKVIVNTKTGKAFRGMLWQRRGGHVVLRAVEMLRERDEALPITGEVIIDRNNVDFIQVI